MSNQLQFRCYDIRFLFLTCCVFRSYRVNGRSSSPTSIGSYGGEDDEGFLVQDHDSDTGVVSAVLHVYIHLLIPGTQY